MLHVELRTRAGSPRSRFCCCCAHPRRPHRDLPGRRREQLSRRPEPRPSRRTGRRSSSTTSARDRLEGRRSPLDAPERARSWQRRVRQLGRALGDGSVVVGGHRPEPAIRRSAGRTGRLTPSRDPERSHARATSRADGSTIVGGWAASEAYRHQGGVRDLPRRSPGRRRTRARLGGERRRQRDRRPGTLRPRAIEAFRWAGGAMHGLGDLDGGGVRERRRTTSASTARSSSAAGTTRVRPDRGVSLGERRDDRASACSDGTYQTRARVPCRPTGRIIVGEAITVPRSSDFASEKVAVIWDDDGRRTSSRTGSCSSSASISAPTTSASALGVSSRRPHDRRRGLLHPGPMAAQRIGWVVVIPEPATAPLLGRSACSPWRRSRAARR